MKNKLVLIVIPCRLGSVRLNQKHLIKLSNGKTIFQMTYENCLKSVADNVIIATDDNGIYNIAKTFTENVVITSNKHKTGTDRVAEVAKNYKKYNYIVNVQGDEPLINPKTINSVINGIRASGKDIKMCTAMTKFSSIEEVRKGSNVKVITDKHNNAIYFSRSIIPYDKDSNVEDLSLSLNNYYKHLGIYAFKRSFLLKYVNINQSKLEIVESLEQLRILENGYKIKVIETKYDSQGIDTIEDLNKLEKYLKLI